MLSSIQPSTLKQYEKPISLWWFFCQKENTSVYDITSTGVTRFFTDTEIKNLSYSSLNIYRSALSLLSLNDLGKDLGLSRFFKGLSILKPQQPKYESIWDPEIVIIYT